VEVGSGVIVGVAVNVLVRVGVDVAVDVCVGVGVLAGAGMDCVDTSVRVAVVGLSGAVVSGMPVAQAAVTTRTAPTMIQRVLRQGTTSVVGPVLAIPYLLTRE
jgi:hypothetical protein